MPWAMARCSQPSRQEAIILLYSPISPMERRRKYISGRTRADSPLVLRTVWDNTLDRDSPILREYSRTAPNSGTSTHSTVSSSASETTSDKAPRADDGSKNDSGTRATLGVRREISTTGYLRWNSGVVKSCSEPIHPEGSEPGASILKEYPLKET